MIVIDASAVIEVLLQSPTGKRVGLRMFAKRQNICAPELLQLEALQVTRRFLASGDLTEVRAREVFEDFLALPLTFYPHGPLLRRIWELRGNYTAYDAAYLALAEALRAELLTCDSALKNSRLHHARVHVID